jgi:hypothetical protein
MREISKVSCIWVGGTTQVLKQMYVFEGLARAMAACVTLFVFGSHLMIHTLAVALCSLEEGSRFERRMHNHFCTS